MAQEFVEFHPQIYTILPANATDERLVELWLHDLAATTQESYRFDIRAFFCLRAEAAARGQPGRPAAVR